SRDPARLVAPEAGLLHSRLCPAISEQMNEALPGPHEPTIVEISTMLHLCHTSHETVPRISAPRTLVEYRPLFRAGLAETSLLCGAPDHARCPGPERKI